MSVRPLAASLTFVLALGLSAVSCAQEKTASSTAKAKAGSTKSKTAAKGQKAEDAKADVKTEKATFGGGCFWCMEAVYEAIPGVKSAVSGYAGGFVRNPSYEMVSTGETGHAEVVQIEYDPEVVSYEKLLNVFWHSHDPTTPNQQGPDFGPQYRSIILYHNEAQKEAAQKSYEKLTKDGAFDSPIVTELVPLKAFYAADKHHQDYYRKNKRAAYCQTYIVPKLKKIQKLNLDADTAAKK
jgi:peptide-methionine (S)-S-oxide reductase